MALADRRRDVDEDRWIRAGDFVRQSARWLRISYWVGAISDGIAAWVMLSQAFLGFESPLTRMIPEIPYRYAMGMAGSLMAGWTILLLWADRKPVERRDVLVITNVVILGLMASGIYAVSSGFAPLSSMAPMLIFQGMLIALFTSSYMNSRGGK